MKQKNIKTITNQETRITRIAHLHDHLANSKVGKLATLRPIWKHLTPNEKEHTVAWYGAEPSRIRAIKKIKRYYKKK